ncbi:MAG: transporter substrate-binding domain-containing protein, partial [Treponema sp.]|nr:transporter substrate-binding domain-containing protein [Treponema sp.]
MTGNLVPGNKHGPAPLALIRSIPYESYRQFFFFAPRLPAHGRAMMGRAVCLLFTSIVFLFTSCSTSGSSGNSRPEYQSFKEIPGVTQEEVSALENLLVERPRLVYGICVSTEAFLLDDGSVGGFAKLFCDRLSELFGFEFDFLPGSWEEMQERIVSKEIDMVVDFTATPERLQKFIMTDAIVQRTIKVFTDINANRLSLTAETRPVKCAFMNGSTTYSHVANSWNMPFEPVFIDDQSEVPDLFLSGRIDAFIEEGTLEAAFDSYDFIKAEEYYPLTYSPISLTSGNPEMTPLISIMQKYLKNGGYYEFTELYNQGYKEYLQHKLYNYLTREEKEYIQSHNDTGTAIVAACEVDNYPTSFYNAQEKEFQGMALDTLKRISDLTGLVFQIGNEPDALWPELIGGLESDKYSIISELLRSSQRANRFLWADQPYCTNKYAMLSSADYPDVDINQILFSRIGLMEGAAHTDVFREWFPNSTNTKLYVSNTDAFAALVKGEIDLLMASENMLLNLTNYQEKPG